MLREFLVKHISSKHYRVVRAKVYSAFYNNWSMTFDTQVRIFFIWMNMKTGYTTCSRAYEDCVKWRKEAMNKPIKKVMSRSDLILEMI